MEDSISKKGVVAEQTSGWKLFVCFNRHFDAISARRLARAKVHNLPAASRFCSNIPEKPRQQLRTFLDRPLRISVITGLVALVLAGLTERASATCTELYNDGVLQLWEGNIPPCNYTTNERWSQATRRNIVYKGYELITGDNIEKIWLYTLDMRLYGYIDRGQYNLLGGMSYILDNIKDNIHYRLWDDFYYNWWRRDEVSWKDLDGRTARWFDSHWMFRILYGPILPLIDLYPFKEIRRDSIEGLVGTGGYHGQLSIASAGDYIDKWQYYLLDSSQYYYLDNWQYKLLGGRSYILGHPCYPLWHHYGYVIPEPSTIMLLGLGFLGTLSIGKPGGVWKRPLKR